MAETGGRTESSRDREWPGQELAETRSGIEGGKDSSLLTGTGDEGDRRRPGRTEDDNSLN